MTLTHPLKKSDFRLLRADTGESLDFEFEIIFNSKGAMIVVGEENWFVIEITQSSTLTHLWLATDEMISHEFLKQKG